jgi:chromosome segregation ATPase
MLLKTIKWTAIGATGLFIAGGVIFGREAFSYVHTGARSAQSAVRDAVPIEFELRRARDLVEQIVPEMHANIRLIAQQEVEIERLGEDIQRSQLALADEKQALAGMRDRLSAANGQVSFENVTWTRQQFAQTLSTRLDSYRDAETALEGKKKLLSHRQESLAAAIAVMERMRSQKTQLESQIAQLETQHRLLQSVSAGSGLAIDDSKLAKTERLIAEIRRKLDVSERVLAHESRFAPMLAPATVNEQALLGEVDELLGEKTASR